MDENKIVSISPLKAIKNLATFLEVDAVKLKQYAFEDPYLGYPELIIGSIYSIEGKLLYATARALNANHIVEIGTWHGVSTTHLALAASHSDGRVISIDLWEREAKMIPPELRNRVTLLRMWGHEYLERFDNQLDFVFEDTDHTYDTTLRLAQAGMKAVKPGGIYITHDSAHERVGADIRRALADAGMQTFDLLVTPSECGLSFWRKPYAKE